MVVAAYEPTSAAQTALGPAMPGETPSTNLQGRDVVKIYEPHGIIPKHISDRLPHIYQNKGFEDLYDDAIRHKLHYEWVRLNRTIKQFLSHRHTVLPDGEDIKVWSAKNTDNLRAAIKRTGDDNPFCWDVDCNEAYNGTKATYLFLKNVYKINSIDGNNYPLYSTVHFERNYCNAYWDGTQMVYGDGDGEIFNRFTISVDVTGHEEHHGLTQDQAGKAISPDGKPSGINYEGEAGGINEALSDIGGIQVKQWSNKPHPLTAAQSDWLIGVGLIKDIGAQKFALRDMLNPGNGYKNHPDLGDDPQVATYSAYKALEAQGAVDPHISSGPVNKWFSTAAVKLGGFAWETVGPVVFQTLPYLRPNETFAGMADKTIQTAITISGKDDSPLVQAVREGWKVTEIKL